MKSKVISIIKGAAIFFCAIYTFGTFTNSALYLWFGVPTNPDVHGHIILRAWVCLVITIIVTLVYILMKHFVLKSKTMKGMMIKYVISCAIILFFVMIYIWVSTSGYFGNVEDIHPNAFRDMSRSIAIPFFVVAVVYGIIIFIRRKREMK